MTDEYSPQIMNVGEVAAYLRVSQATIYRLAQAGQIPSGKVGRAWRFRKDAIDHWITEQPESLGHSAIDENNVDEESSTQLQ